MPLTVRELDEKAEPAWDRYVHAVPEGTFFHLSGWRSVIEQAFRHRSCYLVAERDGSITGVLPLVHLHSRLFGNKLVSVPFCVYGGPLASDPESTDALVGRATDLMGRIGAGAIEFRMLQPAVADWLTRSDLYATFRNPISGDPEVNLKAIPRKQRAMVRKGMQNGLRSEIDTDTGRLHRIYAESVRNLGTPVYSGRYFRILAERFRDRCEILTVVDDEKPIAAVLSFFFRDEVLPYYGGGTAEARQRAGNDFMYWEVMRRAADRGARNFDFGRSKYGTGAFDFKKFWGFTPEPLHYQYKLRPGANIPDHNPLNPKYRSFIAVWRRLPLPVANLLGPAIVRGIG
jgi:FemAB-related protein (PEP-CTERM system-associated)